MLYYTILYYTILYYTFMLAGRGGGLPARGPAGRQRPDDVQYSMVYYTILYYTILQYSIVE